MNIKTNVTYFWKKFLAKKNDIETYLINDDQDKLNEIINDLNFELESISKAKLYVEYVDDVFIFNFENGYDKTAQYISSLIIKFAPNIDGWLFSSYLQPLSKKAINMLFKVEGIEYNANDFIVYYFIDKINKNVDLKIYSDMFLSLNEADKEKYTHIMLTYFIGQLELETRIGNIDIIDAKINEENVLLLPSLYEELCNIIIDNNWIEYDDPSQIYYAYKIDEDCLEESLRNDMYIVYTSYPKLFDELNNDKTEIINDIITLGGEYGYIYYEHKHDGEDKALFRQQLEKSINDLTYSLGVARSIGGALGLKFGYIDLCVFDKVQLKDIINKLNDKLDIVIKYKAF